MSMLSAVADRLMRADSWWNPFTGLGTNRDRTEATRFSRSRTELDDQTLSAVYQEDYAARQIVNSFPMQAFRQGLTYTGEGNAAIKTWADGVRLVQNFTHAWVWSRLYGGSLLVMGADDGQRPDQPLNPAAVRQFTFLEVHDKRRAQVETWNRDRLSSDHGYPEVYRINHLHGSPAYWHASRCIVFPGALTDREEKDRRQGWDLSVLEACWEPLRQYNTVSKSVETLVAESSISIFRMKGLLAALASGKRAEIEARMSLVDMSKSVIRAIMLDADNGEDYRREAVQFAGLPDLADRFATRLAAASETPVTLLMGQAPAGLNATGESDIRGFYDRTKALQEQEMRPRLLRVLALAAIANGLDPAKIGLEFPSLWQETPKEKEDRRKSVAERDKLYIESQVLTPEDVALARFGPGGWSPETTLDPETVAMLRTKPPTPAPAPPPAPAPGVPQPPPAPAPAPASFQPQPGPRG